MYQNVYFYPMTRKNEKKSTLQPLRLTRATGWELAVAEYALGDAQSVAEVRRVLQEKRFTIKDSEAGYRLMNLTELGLVEDSIGKARKAGRLSLLT